MQNGLQIGRKKMQDWNIADLVHVGVVVGSTGVWESL